jgi:hypothetical protein
LWFITSGGQLAGCPGTLVAATEVGCEDFDLCLRRERADLLDAFDKMSCTAVAQVIAVHAGDYGVFEAHLGNGLGQLQRFILVQRIGAAMPHVAKGAAARALVAHDHECGRAMAKALADVGARGFFTHGVEIALAQDLLDLVVARVGRARLHADPLGLFQHLAMLDLDRNARELGSGLLLGQRVVFGGGLCFAHDIGGAHGCVQGASRTVSCLPRTPATSSQVV